jgi:hypothetical protein
MSAGLPTLFLILYHIIYILVSLGIGQIAALAKKVVASGYLSMASSIAACNDWLGALLSF